jgi:purine-binding chemotaxis protein CheW
VIDLEPDQIQPAPRIGTQIRTDFIKGMGKRDTQFIMILDIDRVFSAEELSVVRGQEVARQEAVKQTVEKQIAERQLAEAAA